MTRTRLTWLVVLLALVCAGCGVRPSGAIPGDQAPTGPVYGVTLYFARHNELIPTLRATTNQFTPIEAITALVSGPDSREQSDGMTTQVPPGIVADGLTTDPSGQTFLGVNINPTTLSTVAVGQLTCTAITAIANAGTSINADTFFIAGQGAQIGPLRCPESG
ncbi:MAG TPA: hypothetical protein VJ914_13400 [Pseudonocardiaceae bacterium]|nr:hypothetical protein [Pseudonocardiaceae bacterium]